MTLSGLLGFRLYTRRFLISTKQSGVAKMIEEMMDIKLREQDRKHHHKGDNEAFVAELDRSTADQTNCGDLANLPGAITDLLSS